MTPRQLRRRTHSPTHSGQPVTPSAATGWIATALFASVRESARCTVLQARSASMAQVALRTGINPRASDERGLRRGREQRAGEAPRAPTPRRARDDAEHALGGDRALTRQDRHDPGALIAERRGIAQRKVDLAPPEERAQLRGVAVEVEQGTRRRDDLAAPR